MKFLYLYLENYAGIYNGMHLNSIEIDLSKCMYQTLIIRGENGSGKSTIFKALSVFPEPNDSFLPDLPAKKIISILDHDVIYTITFIHDLKSNGTRDTTKAFIKKNINGYEVELNENGNVSSYKDIIYDELSLDPNFFALSQLSSEDRGLATKRPAERKKFVNSIIESLEVYNGIYKSISKQSSNTKAMMDSLVSKIGSLGDINSLRENLKLYDSNISEMERNKDRYRQTVAELLAKISILDPNGTIQSRARDINKQQKIIYENNLKVISEYCRRTNKPFVVPMDEKVELEQAKKYYEDILIQIEDKKKEINSSILHNSTYLNEISNQIRNKEDKLSSFDNDGSYSYNKEQYERYCNQVNEYLNTIKVSGIDPNAFSQDEYILALQTLKDIKHLADLLRSDFDQSTLEYVVNLYKNNDWNNISNLSTKDELQFMTDYTVTSAEYYKDATILEEQIKSLEKLKDRPVSCKDDTCPFISSLVELAATKPEEKLKSLIGLQKEYDDTYKHMSSELDKKNNINNCINQMRNLIRSITNNSSILLRLPNGGLFSSKDEFFSRLLSGDDFSYMEKMYSYIDLSNVVALYHSSKKLMDTFKQKCDLYESKSDLLGELKSEIYDLKETQVTYTTLVNKDRESLISINQSENEVNLALSNIRYNIDLINHAIENIENSKQLAEEYSTISANMMTIQSYNQSIKEYRDSISYIENNLKEHKTARDNIIFALKQAEQYDQELSALKERYDKIEIIKHYSSPTKGIQLVFMELYMGKILTLANELLSFLFNGEYMIQPFIINESEFRIPCLGQGYINDDISSMSSSQLTMISMIISFSLLHTSSSKYNILKLDEIDGPLDENNRIMFIDVMNRIMSIMNVEQCIMVSHSSELQVDTSDVILLKNSQLSTDYDRGNIIWRYQ